MKIKTYLASLDNWLINQITNSERLIEKLEKSIQDIARKWFTILEWLIVSEAVFYAYLVTKSTLLLVILLVTAGLFIIYLFMDLFRILLKIHHKMRYGKITAFFSTIAVTVIVAYIIFLITSLTVLKLAGVNIVVMPK